jgi:hypothetical protein
MMIDIARLGFACMPGPGGSRGWKLTGTCHFDATFALEAIEDPVSPEYQLQIEVS